MIPTDAFNRKNAKQVIGRKRKFSKGKIQRRIGKLQYITMLVHVFEMVGTCIMADKILRMLMLRKLMQQFFRSDEKRKRCKKEKGKKYAEFLQSGSKIE